MFVQLFATALGLLQVMNTNVTGHQSYGYFQKDSYNDVDRTDYVNSTYLVSDVKGTSVHISELNYLSYGRTGLPAYYYMGVYTIYDYVSNNSASPSAYLEWYVTFTDLTQGADSIFNLRLNSAGTNYNTFNLECQVTFTFKASSGTTPLGYMTQYIDFSDSEYVNITQTKQLGNSSFGPTSSNAVFDVDISFMPMSQDKYNGNVVPQESYEDGFNDGYQDGYSEGYLQGQNLDSTALTIFGGIIDVGLLPVNFFLSILNFEVFGLNIGAIVSATLTVAIVVIIIRVITGKKND